MLGVLNIQKFASALEIPQAVFILQVSTMNIFLSIADSFYI